MVFEFNWSLKRLFFPILPHLYCITTRLPLLGPVLMFDLKALKLICQNKISSRYAFEAKHLLWKNIFCEEEITFYERQRANQMSQNISLKLQ